jgi:hypothetical protein
VPKRFIYGLYDPREPEIIMVVGMTKHRQLKWRLNGYIKTARRGCTAPSHRWVLKLLKQGVQPQIRLLATTDTKRWRASEKRFITIWRKKNLKLLNRLNGGTGGRGGKVLKYCRKCGAKRLLKNDRRWCTRCKRAYMQAHGPAYNRKRWSNPKNVARQLTYMRLHYLARKLGLTVAQYRATPAA